MAAVEVMFGSVVLAWTTESSLAAAAVALAVKARGVTAVMVAEAVAVKTIAAVPLERATAAVQAVEVSPVAEASLAATADRAVAVDLYPAGVERRPPATVQVWAEQESLALAVRELDPVQVVAADPMAWPVGVAATGVAVAPRAAAAVAVVLAVGLPGRVTSKVPRSKPESTLETDTSSSHGDIDPLNSNTLSPPGSQP